MIHNPFNPSLDTELSGFHIWLASSTSFKEKCIFPRDKKLPFARQKRWFSFICKGLCCDSSCRVHFRILLCAVDPSYTDHSCSTHSFHPSVDTCLEYTGWDGKYVPRDESWVVADFFPSYFWQFFLYRVFIVRLMHLFYLTILRFLVMTTKRAFYTDKY